MTRLFRFAQIVVLGGFTAAAVAQSGNASQALTLEGLQTVANHGGFKAAAFAADGSLIVLVDEHDGIRLQKTDGAATAVTATAHAGAAGDSGVAMALDPAGNIYVTGTTTSTSLSGTTGVAFGTRADTSTNSFLAKFDANLNLLYLTFLGAGRTSAAGVAATADAAFVTGVTYSATFPVTASGIQQTPATGTFGNGFVERFSGSGALVYATYLTGLGGDTSAAAIAADSTDAAYVVGMTAATGFPTVNGLVPQMLGTSSGFLAKLTAAGDGFGFSTFVPGTGLTSIAVNSATNAVAMTGNVSLGQFPVATVLSPLANTGSQTLLQVSEDGQTVVSSEALVPGSQSFVTVGAGGSAWVSGAISTPLFPEGLQPNAAMGDSFLLHVTASGAIDQTVRLGGLPVNQAIYSPLTTTAAAPAVNGSIVALPATLTAATNYALLSTERFDLPLVAAPNGVLPNTLRDVIATCTSGQCSGTAGLLEELSTTATGAVIGLSVDGSPNIVVRNVGSIAATGLTVTASGFTVSGTSCGATLDVSAQCTVALAGSGPGTITVSAANAATASASLPATALAANPLALSTPELDFGVAAADTVTRTLTVSNLTAATQTFSSALDKTKLSGYTITESASTCGGAAAAHTLAANATCTITLALTPSTSSANDSAVSVEWLIGTQDVLLTGFTQAAALSVSASEVDFGLQYSGATALRVPRYLYLSNNSGTALAHTAVATAAGSAFTAQDHCPATLEPHTVCGIALAYSAASAPSKDSLTLTVDGLSVLLTGTTLPPAGVTGSTANPNLTVSPASVSFGTAVVVTGVSGTTQAVTIKNTGSSAVPLTLAITGDFTLSSNCPAALSGGASCTATIGFAPSQPGARQGLLSVTGGSGFAPATWR